MPDQEIIDRVVKASFDCWNKHKGTPFTVDNLSDDEKEFAIEHAKAIIEAMRVPTERMTSIEHGYYAGEIAWQAMIDSILK